MLNFNKPVLTINTTSKKYKDSILNKQVIPVADAEPIVHCKVIGKIRPNNIWVVVLDGEHKGQELKLTDNSYNFDRYPLHKEYLCISRNIILMPDYNMAFNDTTKKYYTCFNKSVVIKGRVIKGIKGCRVSVKQVGRLRNDYN